VLVDAPVVLLDDPLVTELLVESEVEVEVDDVDDDVAPLVDEVLVPEVLEPEVLELVEEVLVADGGIPPRVNECKNPFVVR
jgi:hypothetical protein